MQFYRTEEENSSWKLTISHVYLKSFTEIPSEGRRYSNELI